MINDKEFETNKQEINLFNLLYPSSSTTKEDTSLNQEEINNKRKELHKIINLILSKPYKRNIISNNDIYCQFLKKEMNRGDKANI